MEKLETLKENTEKKFYRFAEILESEEGEYVVFMSYTTPGAFNRVKDFCECRKIYKNLSGAKKASLKYVEKNIL